MNVWTKFHGNPFNSCWDISVWTKVVNTLTCVANKQHQPLIKAFSLLVVQTSGSQHHWQTPRPLRHPEWCSYLQQIKDTLMHIQDNRSKGSKIQNFSVKQNQTWKLRVLLTHSGNRRPGFIQNVYSVRQHQLDFRNHHQDGQDVQGITYCVTPGQTNRYKERGQKLKKKGAVNYQSCKCVNTSSHTDRRKQTEKSECCMFA